MEKTLQEVFNEIQTTVAGLRSQLDELEQKLAELKSAEKNVIPSEVEESPEPEIIDLDIDISEPGHREIPDTAHFQWMIDIPGSPVANVISAISLNDRVLFINTLFKEDPSLFQDTIAAFNKMESITEAISYVVTNFPEWNLGSEVVYRLMMAVRRKLDTQNAG